jgi:hypothetical protein
MTILVRFSVGRMLLHVLAMLVDHSVRFHWEWHRKGVAMRALDTRGARACNVMNDAKHERWAIRFLRPFMRSSI